jgi:CheY-like chemotaxis protein/tetratricopeptide (TPR) repeat protein
VSEPRKVLVIEDDLHTQRILTQILTRETTLRPLQLQVVLAVDGEEGLARLEQQTFDLVITDLLMPKVDGFKVVEKIRADPALWDLPILVTSAVFRDKATLKRLETDFRVVVQPKPFSPAALAKVVLALLNRKPPPKVEERAAAKPVRPPPSALVRKVLEPDSADAASPRAKASTAAPAQTPATQAPTAAPAKASPAAPASKPAPRLQGSLVDTSVPQLLLSLAEEQLSGTLDLRRGKVRKLIHVMSGHPIFVQSNQRGETLGQMLVRRGVVTVEQHTRTLAVAKQEGLKYGEALVRLGLLTEPQVMDELLTQTRLKVESCLGWRTGSYTFDEDPQIGAKVPRCVLEPVQLVFDGLQRCPDVEESFARLADKGNALVEPTPRLEIYREHCLAAFGPKVLDALNPPQPLAKVIQAAGVLQEALLQIEIMLQTGMVRLVPQQAEGSPLPPPSSQHLLLDQLEPALSPEPALSGAPEPSWEEDSAVVPMSFEQQPRVQPRPPPPVDAERVRVALQLIEATYLGLHDATHYQVLGVAPQSGLPNIEVAYKIKRKQFDLNNFSGMDLGDHYSHLEEICAALDEAFAVLSVAEARAVYDQTLGAGTGKREVRDGALRGETVWRKGEELFQAGRHAEAAQAFADALELDDQAEYRAMHALAVFLACGKTPQAAEEAMIEVQTALACDPGDVTVHLVAGKISRALGHVDEARQHLQRLVKLDPTCQEGFDELEGLLLDCGDLEGLELEYRRTLHLVGQQDLVWRAHLWRRLTLHYRDRLRDHERARVACEAALRFSPDDQQLRQILADLNRDQPERWPEAVLGYRSLLRSAPDQAEPLHRLVQLHQQAGRLDAAYIAACAAEACDGAQPDEQQLVDEHRPVFLKRAARPLDDAEWQLLLHPEDDPGLAALFSLLTPVMQRLHPLRLTDLDVAPSDVQTTAALPEAFSSVLDYVSGQLGASIPTVAVKAGLGLDVLGAGTDPPSLLVGSLALALEDRLELCFRLGRAVTLMRPGRIAAAWRPRRLLRSYILASLRSAFPQLVVPDPDGLVERIRVDLDGVVDLQPAVKAAVTGLHKRFVRLNLGDWQRGIQRTAERVGLLLCTDLGVACRVLAAQDVEAEHELVDFALSESFGALRAAVGLSVG